MANFRFGFRSARLCSHRCAVTDSASKWASPAQREILDPFTLRNYDGMARDLLHSCGPVLILLCHAYVVDETSQTSAQRCVGGLGAFAPETQHSLTRKAARCACMRNCKGFICNVFGKLLIPRLGHVVSWLDTRCPVVGRRLYTVTDNPFPSRQQFPKAAPKTVMIRDLRMAFYIRRAS